MPAALLGVPAQVIAIVAPIHLFAQFWYHTQHINKMGFLEKIIVTPSHHRVHHAINTEYIDKNYGQIFIFWDKMFGTFQEELPEVPPVYGITRPVQNMEPDQNKFSACMVADKRCMANTKAGKINYVYGSAIPAGDRQMLQKNTRYIKLKMCINFEKYDTQTSPIFEHGAGYNDNDIIIRKLYIWKYCHSLAALIYLSVWRFYFFNCICLYRTDGWK